MGHDSFEDGWFISRLGSQIGVEILKFYLLSSEIIGKAAKLGAAVFLAILVLKGVAGDALSHGIRVLFQSGTHD
jgi:hypothetical protein